MTSHAEEMATAQGLSVVFDVCAEVFLNEPDERVLSDIRSVADTLGVEAFDGIVAGEELTQRYYDRLFVTVSPFYVPLIESSIAGGGTDESGVMHYAAVDSTRTDHALRCYQAIGFEYRELKGYSLAVANLKPDSLASELACLAVCTREEAAAWEADDEMAANRWAALSRRFADEHLGRWVGKAAACLSHSDDDLYARTCQLAEEAVATLQAR